MKGEGRGWVGVGGRYVDLNLPSEAVACGRSISLEKRCFYLIVTTAKDCTTCPTTPHESRSSFAYL